jgi:mannan endo-1,4-beta-mannosidase
MSTKLELSLPSGIALVLASILSACSGSDANDDGSGGSVATTGGTSTVGPATGGASTASSTLASVTGGTTTLGSTTTSTLGGAATGGNSSVGGAATGGSTVGGKSSVGGAATGGSTVGGKSSIGGAATGGAGTGGNSAGCTATGFYTKSGKIYDSHCNEFVMRGINYPYAWFTTNTQQRFADIASVKANVVRVVLSVSRWSTTSASTVSSIISWAKTNKLVTMLEVHDCTGYGDDSAALPPDTCAAYWLKSDMVTALKGNEAYVMINIANEAFGNASTSTWASFYTTNVPKFRTAGLHHTLVVDAPNWGQDWSNTMRDGTGATTIFNADPDGNVVFSVHMYDIYSTAATVTSYFSKFLAKGLPFIVGEFAADHGTKGDVDEATILSSSVQNGTGYLGWSWSGNSTDLATLDMTNNFDVSSLTTWGSRLIDGANGIEATAKTCTVFP